MTTTERLRSQLGHILPDKSAADLDRLSDAIEREAEVSAYSRAAVLLLVQGLAKGRLDGEELRAVMEGMLGVSLALEKHLGIGPRDLLTRGASADEVVAALCSKPVSNST